MNFLELKTLYRPNYLSDLLLFNNKEIKIDGNSIFYSNWSEKAVLTILGSSRLQWKVLIISNIPTKI